MNDPVSLLPHRPPFRFVDRVDELVAGDRVTARYRVTGDEPFLAGHFPGRPVVPGVLVLDHVFQALEQAWGAQDRVIAELGAKLGPAFTAIVVPAEGVSLADAVATYLFNAQLLPRAEGGYLLVAPAECRENPRVAAYLDALIAGGGPIVEILTFDLRQSMRNGGGPACLRLAVTLTAAERDAIPARVFLDDALAEELDRWVRKHYRDRLAPEDLGDPALVDESRRALDELTRILKLPAIYPFQL